MYLMYCRLEDLRNESDVEQKFILPLLSRPQPEGLGYQASDFYTKEKIQPRDIGKGTSKKWYFPDYLVHSNGFPSIVIEAKAPGEDLSEGYREARLYAAELNASFPKGINPCTRVVAINGKSIIAGSWDSDGVDISVAFEDVSVGHSDFSKLLSYLNKSTIERAALDIRALQRGSNVFSRPTKLLGGRMVQGERIPDNSLGSALALQYRTIFNPEEKEDRVRIVQNAYISTEKIRKFLDPIRTIINAATPLSTAHAVDIANTSNPKEIVAALSGPDLRKQVLLLVGNVGSGKSTFVDYLQEVALPEELKKSTFWVSLDLNNAPLARETIYSWIQEEIIKKLKGKASFDTETLESQLKIYAPELSSFKKSMGTLHGESSSEYKKLLGERLMSLQQNSAVTARAYTRYFCGGTGVLLVLVLDNCDKGKQEDQLLMFEVAKWAKEEYHSLVFLPMRETTYEANRTKPPLDTTIKDLTFKIDPPDLKDVLYRRVEYALSQGPSTLNYFLSNGIRVICSRNEQRLYLSSILHSLFDNSKFFRGLMSGLAGRDIRRGIELFLDLCKSGHIPSLEFFKVRASRGESPLKEHLIMKALLRNNRLYYSDEDSALRNLFTSHPEEDQIPNPFQRLAILDYLDKNRGIKGPNNVAGFHQVQTVITTLSIHGHDEKRILTEIGELVKARCLYSESQIEDGKPIAREDLIKISPTGIVHLDLLQNLDYLAACAEDVLYKEIATAHSIADRITSRTGGGHLSFASSVANADDLLNYLIKYRDTHFPNPLSYLKDKSFQDRYSLIPSLEQIQLLKAGLSPRVDPVELKAKYLPGSEFDAKVVSIKAYGYFVEFEAHAIGLIPAYALRRLAPSVSYEIGTTIRVRILRFNDAHQKFDLIPVENKAA